MIERLEIWITITGKKQEDMERVGGGLCQDLAEENNFLVKLKFRKKRDMGYFLLTHVCYERDVGHGMDDPISDLQKKKG